MFYMFVMSEYDHLHMLSVKTSCSRVKICLRISCAANMTQNLKTATSNIHLSLAFEMLFCTLTQCPSISKSQI